MIIRTDYLNELIKWKDEKVIKVVTGIRRCGKSTLLEQFQEYLKSHGVLSKQIIAINFESLEFEDLLDYRKLYDYIASKLQPDVTNYIFLDEIQMVEDYQKAVDSLYIKKDVDLYITGSNAYLLSGELATLLSGRYVEINMLPLSFKEFRSVYSEGSDESALAEYMRYGALPYIVSLKNSNDMANTYLEGIYNTIIVKDIEERQKRKTKPDSRRVSDIALLKNIAKFLASSVGNPISIKSIADYITSSGRRVSQNTISDYVSALIEPYVFYTAERYDVEGKQLLKQSPKYYISDLGIRRYIVSKQNYDLGFSLENIVFLELKRRGYKVNIGKVGSKEVDFVTEKDGVIEYIQVTASMTDEKTFDREIAPLKNIGDNYSKKILTLDKFTLGNYEGIIVENVVDWLLE